MKPLRIFSEVKSFEDEVIRRALQYEKEVLDGTIIAPDKLIKGVKRSQRLRTKYSFDEGRVRNVAGFFYHAYIKIDDRPTQAVPMGWQAFILYNLFGTVRNDKRLYREVLLMVSRGNSKTMFFTVINLYMMMIGGGMDSETVCAAMTQKQSGQALKYAKSIVRNSPELKSRVQCLRDGLIYDDGSDVHTMDKASQQQSDNLDGLSISSVIVDEYHAYRDNNLLEVLKTSQTKRAEPLLLICTTGGFLTVGYPLYDRIQLANDVLNGTKDEDSTFYIIYENESEEEVADGDIEILRKSNPSLGEAINKDDLLNERENAKLLPSSWRHFLVKHANMFRAENADPFISNEDWMSSSKDIPYEELKGGRAWVGVDLSTTVDITAFAVLVEHPVTKTLHAIPYHYFPNKHPKAATNKVRANGVDLTEWIEEGYIKKHGERIDYKDVYDDLMEIYETYDVIKGGYDAHSAYDLQSMVKTNFDYAHIPFEAVSQSTMTLSSPTKYLEELVTTNNIVLDSNPMYAYCNSNARIKYSFSSNLIRVVKDEQLNPIDSLIATIVAMVCYMETEFSTGAHITD